ncbi:MAG: discoidin domain-containing protein, partial [Anaerolineae bacterium]|nr:discoidin domain-containing protein [Anaerolineae bacterium]
MLKRSLVLVIVLSLALSGLASVALAQDGETPQFITHNGQELFLSGINLAWISFAHDLDNFNETTWVAVMDEIAKAHGNTLRWWLHTDGSASPIYGDDGKVVGLGENDIKNLKRGIDLAYERGILVMPVLWSHDMLKEKAAVPAEWNTLMIEDPDYTQAYIDNALIPMVEALAGHPGIVAWEIFNEPEGVTEEFGWTEYHTTMPYIQQFVNLLAGAIHRTDPGAKVTNGSWNMRVLTDIGDFYNYYTDERLIEAGGDPDGTLDFYQVHFYPEHFGDDTSPFHNPASHWELDKPLIIGEFPAAGIKNLGMGYRPEGRIMRNSIESYQNLYENGYAGALAWQWAGGDHGNLEDTKPGLYTIFNIAPEHVAIDLSDLDHIPVIEAPIENVFVPNDTEEITVANLADVFEDVEDGDTLAYEITQNSNPDLITPAIDDSGELSLTFEVGPTGTGNIEITATDSGGNISSVAFVVQVVDPNRGNVALGKPTTASTLESLSYLAEYATDGVDNTRWSTEYADDQWLMVDLEGVFEIGQFVLEWETAFGKSYELQVWDGAAWQTVYSEAASDGDIDDIALDEAVLARYVRLHGIERATEWGFSLWEFEVYGIAADGDFEALEAAPDAEVPAATAEPEMIVTDSAVLFDFEDGAQGWEVATDWPQVTAAEVVDGALVMSGAWIADGWNEGGVFVQNDEGWDLSAYSLLTVEVCAPEGAVEFFGQIFMKTGEEWTWANNPGGAPAAGDCMVYEADLADMGDMTNVKQIGVKIGTSATAFEGSFSVDNVTVLALEAPVEMVP